MPKLLRLVSILVLASGPATAWSGCDTTCGLSEFNRDLLLEYLLHHNTEPLRAATVEDYFVLTPGGIETRDEALAGAGLVDVTDAEVYTHRIEVSGDTAVLAGKIRASGTLNGRPMPELGFLSVFRMVDGEWFLVARSLVPQVAPPAAAAD
jgi:Domain of unknown function (DUF4440)